MSNITEKRKLGNLGEDLACRFLMKHSFTIIDRNYLKKCGEIDIIAIKDGIIHFLEVKSVSGEIIPDASFNRDDDYKPEDNVHTYKLQRLIKTIQIYLTEKNVSGICTPNREIEWQIDVITVIIDKKSLKSRVSLLENIII